MEETKNITLERLYVAIKTLQLEIQNIKQKIEKTEELFLADENLLAESWNSEEDDKAFAYLQ